MLIRAFLRGMAFLEIVLHCSRTELINRQAGKSDHPRTSEARLWLATIAELRTRSDDYADLLDPDERARAERFRFDADRERFVLGHGFLRETLATALELEPSEIRYGRGTHGKPFIEGHSVRFNFSDTKDSVLVGFTMTLLVGGRLALDGDIALGVFSMLVYMTQRLLWPLPALAETPHLYHLSLIHIPEPTRPY